MTTTQHAAHEAIAACLRMDRAKVAVFAGLRVAVVALIVLLVSNRLGHFDFGAAMTVGLLLAPVSDAADTYLVRMKLMLWTTLWLGLACLIGGLVSDYVVAHVIVAFIAAAATGYSASLGPRAAMIGVMALAVFSVYSGNAISVGNTLIDALAVAIGGALMTLIVCAPWPLHRLNGERASVANAYKEFAAATQRQGDQLASPVVALAIANATTAVDHSGATGPTREWLSTLLVSLGQSRVALQAMLFERHRSPDYVDAVIAASGTLATAMAHALILPGRVRHLPGLITALQRSAASPPSVAAGDLADELCAPLIAAASSMLAPWPIGRAATLGHPRVEQPPFRSRLTAHLHWSDPLVEHALRLSFAYGVATIISRFIDMPNAYWFPLTIAWIAKPDLGGTLLRIVMRVAGTIAGVLLAAIVLHLQPGTTGLVLFVAVGCYIALAYLAANYAIAVMGITILVIMLDTGAGQNGAADTLSRCVLTLAAGVFVYLLSIIRPRRGGMAILQALQGLSAAVRAYTNAVREGVDSTATRAVVLRHRTLAVTAISASVAEPGGLWERPGPRIDTGTAALILHDYLDTTTAVIAEELMTAHGHHDTTMWPMIDAQLVSLEARVAAL